MTKTEYEEALYTAKLIVSKRVSDWAVSHHAIVELARALVDADKKCYTPTREEFEYARAMGTLGRHYGDPTGDDLSDHVYRLKSRNEKLEAVLVSLREIVAYRERVTRKNGGPNTGDGGSDGRYARARAALEALDAPEKPKGGLAAIAGKWPGEESDEEMAKIFAELAKSED